MNKKIRQRMTETVIEQREVLIEGANLVNDIMKSNNKERKIKMARENKS